MKKIFAVIVAIGAGWIGSTYYSSGVAENIYQADLDKLMKNSNFELISNEYNKGLFQSNVISEMKFVSEKDQFPHIKFDTVIHHGPIAMGDGSPEFALAKSSTIMTLVAIDDDMRAIFDKLQLDGNATINSVYQYGDTVDTSLNIPSARFSDGKDKAEFGGMQLTAKSDLAVSWVKGDVSTKNLVIEVDGSKVTINGGQGSYDMTSLDDLMELALGTFTYSTESISIESATNPMANMTLQNIGFSSDTKLVNEKINSTQNFTIENVKGLMPISNINYSMETNGISPEAIKKFKAFQENMDSENFNNDEFKAIVEQFLKPGLEFNNRVDLRLFEKPLLIDLNITYIGMPDGSSISDITDPMQALAAIKAKFYAEVDEGTVSSFDQAGSIQTYINSGFIKASAEKLILDAEFKDSQLFINGQPAPIMEMLGGAFGTQ